MRNTSDESVPQTQPRPRRGDSARAYHHGDLRNGLLEAARAILEDQDLSALTLRAVARRAGVSHAAPYRHFPNHEALLVELGLEGFAALTQVRERLIDSRLQKVGRRGHFATA